MKRRSPFPLALALCVLIAAPAAANDRLVIHEWGTFTSLQNDNGDLIAGVNTDDEPVPGFVHDIGNTVTRSVSQMSPAFQANMTKGGIPRLHPDVTMRLETPVVYFHLPKGVDHMTLDLDVTFRGGWLSQYYPDAESNTSGEDVTTKHITADTAGALSWKGLDVGGAKKGPETTEHVWLAPRAVQASPVTTAKGESEKYLFYRGVGKLDKTLLPVTLVREPEGGHTLWTAGTVRHFKSWLVDVREDGKIAFQHGHDPQRGVAFYRPFTEKDYAASNLPLLQNYMQGALTVAGLFQDEAKAMVKTWEHSYFRSPGQRLFYIVPKEWVELVLPMKVSVPADITRVMVGRIEIVHPRQQSAMREMRSSSADGVAAFIRKSTTDVKDWTVYQEVSSGKKPLDALGAQVPGIYKSYLKLGRFRDAILLEENARRSAPALKTFIRENRIGMYEVK
ncbi:MAG: hypothetical protein EPN97_14535 [Alphaproteobacteria bacterium]|nr:MAG: hypothetical protein EPN97_14535 [Alphaproteobacteria bacterium]